MSLDRMARSAERNIIREALRQEGGNVSRCSRSLEVPMSTLWWKIRDLGIDPDEFRVPRREGRRQGGGRAFLAGKGPSK